MYVLYCRKSIKMLSCCRVYFLGVYGHYWYHRAVYHLLGIRSQHYVGESLFLFCHYHNQVGVYAVGIFQCGVGYVLAAHFVGAVFYIVFLQKLLYLFHIFVHHWHYRFRCVQSQYVYL